MELTVVRCLGPNQIPMTMPACLRIDEVLYHFDQVLRNLLPDDWIRLEYYARKIRKLTVQDIVYGTVDKSFFIALATYRPVRNPFQNLQQIAMRLTHTLGYKSAPYMEFLLGPNILGVSITVGSSRPGLFHVSLLLPSIPRLCPNLQDFDVHGKLPKLDFERDVFQNICSMHNLRTLDLENLKPPDGMIGRILHHLGSLTSLEYLYGLYVPTEIQSLNRPDLILPPFSMVNHWFPKLRDLCLILEDVDTAVFVMDSMHLPFHSLTFQLEGQHLQPHSPSKLLQYLGRNPHLPLSLSILVIFEDPIHSLAHDVEILSDFKLPALTNLQTLRLQFSGVEILDDVWLNQASRSFPQLRVLELPGRALRRKRITLAGYVPLVQNCPRLSHISVATACESFDTRKTLPPGLWNQSPIGLDFSHSSIESPVGSIFRCLVLMFPNLQYFRIPYNFPSEEARKSWTDLLRLVGESQDH